MRLAQPKDKNLVIEILMSAFLHEPAGNSLNYFVTGEHNREERVHFMFDYIVSKALKTGEIYLSTNEKGVIVVDYSNRKCLSITVFLKKLKAILRSIGLKNLSKISKRQQLLNRFHKEKNFAYPVAMAAHKSVNGNGTCVRMIMKLLHENANSGKTVYTETTTQENLKIYKKFGFELIGKSDELGFPMYFLKLNLD